MTRTDPAVLATSVRSGFVESVHLGHAVIVDPDGSIVRAWGDPDVVILPRSSNKPAQATALVANGLDVPTSLLALAAASHNAEDIHLAGTRDLLVRAGLDESALLTPPDYPLDPEERDRWVREDRAPVPIGMNCSGKHAAMLLTCVQQGWSTQDYTDPAHPLQQQVHVHVERLAGTQVRHVAVDGCGAPLLALPLVALARSVSACVTAAPGEPERLVADAMRAHPEMVGGRNSETTRFMRAVPGLLAKEGADGVQVAALPDGRAVALKVRDGGLRSRKVALAALLVAVGVDADLLDGLLTEAVLGGGRPVGEVRSPLADA